MRLVTAGTALSAAALIACCTSDNRTVRAADWTLVATPAANKVVISIGVGSGSCDKLKDVTVNENAKVVTILAFVEHQGNQCTTDFHAVAREVVLREPLGDRALEGCHRNAASGSIQDVESANDCRYIPPG